MQIAVVHPAKHGHDRARELAHHQPPARPQDPPQLEQAAPRLWQVAQPEGDGDHVDRGVAQRQPHRIGDRQSRRASHAGSGLTEHRRRAPQHLPGEVESEHGRTWLQTRKLKGQPTVPQATSTAISPAASSLAAAAASRQRWSWPNDSTVLARSYRGATRSNMPRTPAAVRSAAGPTPPAPMASPSLSSFRARHCNQPTSSVPGTWPAVIIWSRATTSAPTVPTGCGRDGHTPPPHQEAAQVASASLRWPSRSGWKKSRIDTSPAPNWNW